MLSAPGSLLGYATRGSMRGSASPDGSLGGGWQLLFIATVAVA